MKKLYFTLLVFSLINLAEVRSQTLICMGEEVCLVTSARGTVTWESSTDMISWLYNPNWSGDTFCVRPLTTTWYRAKAAEGNCSPVFSDTIQVVVRPQPTADAGRDTLFCSGGSASVGGSPAVSGGTAPYTYAWTPATGLSSASLSNPVASPVVTTDYMLTVTDVNGCHDSDSVRISVNPSPVANAGPDTGFVCPGSVTIGANPTASGGTPPYVYAWTPNTSLSSASVANPVANPLNSLTYNLQVTDANSCIDWDTVVVTVTNGGGGPGSQTFSYTGGVQTFTVPNCTYSVTVDVYGAQGGIGGNFSPGLGGLVHATLAVTPGQQLQIFVGGAGANNLTGGYNGGGNGNSSIPPHTLHGGGGGGASDIRVSPFTLNDRIVVAGGGGGAGGPAQGGGGGGGGGGYYGGGGGGFSLNCCTITNPTNGALGQGGLGGGHISGCSCSSTTGGGAGGNGGGTSGANGSQVNANSGGGGTGGTQVAGGTAGTRGLTCSCNTDSNGGGGGGGSSYTSPACTGVTHMQGVRSGNGQVIISW